MDHNEILKSSINLIDELDNAEVANLKLSMERKAFNELFSFTHLSPPPLAETLVRQHSSSFPEHITITYTILRLNVIAKYFQLIFK